MKVVGRLEQPVAKLMGERNKTQLQRMMSCTRPRHCERYREGSNET